MHSRLAVHSHVIGKFAEDGTWTDVPRGHKNPLYSKLAERLGRTRAAASLTYKALGDLSGMTPTGVAAVEAGVKSKISTVEHLASSLGVPVVWLAFGPDGAAPFRERVPRLGIKADDDPEPDTAARERLELWRGMAARLREAREARMMSMRELSRLAGVTASNISLLEAGGKEPLVSTCEELARALDVAPGWLAYGIGQGPASARG